MECDAMLQQQVAYIIFSKHSTKQRGTKKNNEKVEIIKNQSTVDMAMFHCKLNCKNNIVNI